MRFRSLVCGFGAIVLSACSTTATPEVVKSSSQPEAAASATPSVVPFPAKSADVTRLGVGRGFSAGSLSAKVGDPVELGVGMSPDVTPALTPEDPAAARASIRWTDWNLCIASLTPLRPGPIPFTVSLNDKTIRGLVAGLDPATTSTRVDLPVGVPTTAPDATDGIWVITDVTSWRGFLTHVTTSDAAAPVDLSTRSLVAVICDSEPQSDAPVVTQVSLKGDPVVTVVKPQLPVDAPSTAVQRHVVSLLSIPQVPPGASAVFVTLASVDSK